MAELEVVIDGRPAKRGAEIVIRSLKGIQTQTAKTDRGLKKTSKSLKSASSAASGFRRAVGAVSAALVARQIVRYSDAYTLLQSRIRLVTNSQEELNASFEEVFQIAQRTRAPLEATGELYARIARSSDDLGKTNAELLAVTESVSQAITISGVSAQAANAAIVQLGQGLASGTLRGDELRSVLEQTPRLARAIADGMDIPIGALRELGKQGKLTARAVIGALEDQAEVLEREFKDVGPTIGQGFTLIENALIRSIGRFNDATGAAGGFADMLIDIATFIEKDFTPGLLEFGDNLALAFDEMEKGAEGTTLAWESMGVDIDAVMDNITKGLIELPRTMVNTFSIITTEMGGFFATIITDLEARINVDKQRFAALFGNEEELARLKSEGAALQLNAAAVEAEVVEQRIALGDRLLDQEKELARAANARKGQGKIDFRRRTGASEGADVGPTPASVQQLKDAKKLLEGIRTPQEEFNDQIAEINALQKAGAFVGDEYQRVLTRTAEAFSATLPEAEAWEDSLKEAKELTEELQTPEEAHIARITKFGEFLDKGIISWETYNRALKDSAETLQEADPAFAAQEERMERIAELTEEVQTPLEEYNAKLAELATLEDDIDPDVFIRLKDAAKEAFEEATIAADPFLEKLQSIGESAASGIESAFTDFLIDPSKEGFEEMGATFARVLQKMAAEALSAQILQGIFGGMAGASGAGGGLGGLLGAGLTAFAAADGGTFPGGSPVLVGEEGPEIIVPGSQSTVIPNGESMSMLQPQAPPVVNVTPQIINVQDPQAAVAAIESSGGQQAILNAISQNPDAIKRALS